MCFLISFFLYFIFWNLLSKLFILTKEEKDQEQVFSEVSSCFHSLSEFLYTMCLIIRHTFDIFIQQMTMDEKSFELSKDLCRIIFSPCLKMYWIAGDLVNMQNQPQLIFFSRPRMDEGAPWQKMPRKMKMFQD